MPLTFPSSPTVGQQSTQNGRTYQWSGSAWELVVQTATGTAITDASLITTGTLPDARLSSAIVRTTDSRLSDQRTPSDASVTDAKIATAGLSTSSINYSAIAAWQPNTFYNKGDLVSNNGIAYRRISAGTTSSTFVSTNWNAVTPSSIPSTMVTGLSSTYVAKAGDTMTGQLRTASGTLAAPGITGGANTDSGVAIGRVTANSVELISAGQQLVGCWNNTINFVRPSVVNSQMTFTPGTAVLQYTDGNSVTLAGGCAAWVNFNGTGTGSMTIRGSGNVSSVTRGATGQYSINFSSALPDTVYAAICTAYDASGATSARSYPNTTSSAVVLCYNAAQSAFLDVTTVQLAIFR